MVDYSMTLDTVFGSLADPTRRDILARLVGGPLNVSEVAEPYNISLEAVSKHLKILERTHLVSKRKEGNERVVTLESAAMRLAAEYVEQYERLWKQSLDKLAEVLSL